MFGIHVSIIFWPNKLHCNFHRRQMDDGYDEIGGLNDDVKWRWTCKAIQMNFICFSCSKNDVIYFTVDIFATSTFATFINPTHQMPTNSNLLNGKILMKRMLILIEFPLAEKVDFKLPYKFKHIVITLHHCRSIVVFLSLTHLAIDWFPLRWSFCMFQYNTQQYTIYENYL